MGLEFGGVSQKPPTISTVSSLTDTDRTANVASASQGISQIPAAATVTAPESTQDVATISTSTAKPTAHILQGSDGLWAAKAKNGNVTVGKVDQNFESVMQGMNPDHSLIQYKGDPLQVKASQFAPFGGSVNTMNPGQDQIQSSVNSIVGSNVNTLRY